MKYSIVKVATLIGAHRFGDFDGSIAFLLTDSRSLCFPEETLFFAIRSQRNDGHHFIADLYRRGVRGFVVEQVPADYNDLYPQAAFLKVNDSRKALQRLAERHRDELSIPIVGITGSNGKTMVKEWLSQLMSPTLRVARSPRSYNSQIGVPLSVWLMEKTTELGIFEAGISEPGEMLALRDIIQPTIAVLTNLGQAHQENFPSMEAKCREKAILFHDAETIVYPMDDDIIRKVVGTTRLKGRLMGWSRKDQDAPFYVKAVDKQPDATTITYVYHNQEHHYAIPFIDDASITCSIECAAVACHLGLSAQQLDERMQQLEPVAMRLEVKEGRHDCTLINDSYNSDVNSLDIALDFMNRRPDHNGRRRTLILSDIFQSGLTPEQLYATVSDMVSKRGVEKFIGIGQQITAQIDLIDVKEKYSFTTTEQFLKSDVFAALRSEVILLKGARQYGFDRITELLVQKVHETVLEVNLNALVDNLNYYRSFLNPQTKMVCMIKADAYGAGSVEIAKTLQDHRVDYLAVAVADEGAMLRGKGITSNIMIMNPEMSAFKTMFDNDLEPEVYSFRLLDALIRAAEREGITGYPVHIKLDTGMHRLGFHPEEDIDQLIERLKQTNAVMPRSVFTHYVGADDDRFDSFSDEQFARFDRASQKLQQAFDHKILRHIDNSAGILHYPERQLDMCRLGIGLYGVDNRTNKIINNVSTLKTTILQLRRVPATDTVGYSRNGKLTQESIIADIPIGYADGLNRHLGNRHGYCLVAGCKAPYVGNICMDVAMVDVTGIACKEGDTVEIFGDNLPVTVLSDQLDTIPYEVLTGISHRVKRVYYQD